jgi:hypothetical protein
MRKAPFRICAFDLETTSLSADLGVILCAVLKEQDDNRAKVRASSAQVGRVDQRAAGVIQLRNEDAAH